MPASDTSLPLRIGARTLWTLRRRLVRRRLSLEEALGGGCAGAAAAATAATRLSGHRPARGAGPARWPRAMAGSGPFVRQRYRRCLCPARPGFRRLSRRLLGQEPVDLPAQVEEARRALGRRARRPLLRGPRRRSRCSTRSARAVSAKTYQERLLDAGLPRGADALAGMRALARGRPGAGLAAVPRRRADRLSLRAGGRVRPSSTPIWATIRISPNIRRARAPARGDAAADGGEAPSPCSTSPRAKGSTSGSSRPAASTASTCCWCGRLPAICSPAMRSTVRRRGGAGQGGGVGARPRARRPQAAALGARARPASGCRVPGEAEGDEQLLIFAGVGQVGHRRPVGQHERLPGRDREASARKRRPSLPSPRRRAARAKASSANRASQRGDLDRQQIPLAISEDRRPARRPRRRRGPARTRRADVRRAPARRRPEAAAARPETGRPRHNKPAR